MVLTRAATQVLTLIECEVSVVHPPRSPRYETLASIIAKKDLKAIKKRAQWPASGEKVLPEGNCYR